jgi:predicted dehydrogenase
MGKPVPVGVLGLRRGAALARLARQAGMQVVAVCERDAQRGAAGGAAGQRGAPEQDVYVGVELSVTGIQAMRSSLAASALVEVPDLRDQGARRAHAGDDWFPDLPEL